MDCLLNATTFPASDCLPAICEADLKCGQFQSNQFVTSYKHLQYSTSHRIFRASHHIHPAFSHRISQCPKPFYKVWYTPACHSHPAFSYRILHVSPPSPSALFTPYIPCSPSRPSALFHKVYPRAPRMVIQPFHKVYPRAPRYGHSAVS